MLRWAYKKGREILRRMSMLRAPLLPAHPQFGQDSKAAFAEPGPVPFDAPKIIYSAEDDAAIDANVRNMGESFLLESFVLISSKVATAWHSVS